MSATELLILFVVSLVANILSALAGGGAGLLQTADVDSEELAEIRKLVARKSKEVQE